MLHYLSMLVIIELSGLRYWGTDLNDQISF